MNEPVPTDLAQAQSRRILAWRTVHGWLMLATALLALYLDRPVIVAVVGMVSLLTLAKVGSVPRQPGDRFNFVNWITVARILAGVTVVITPILFGPMFACIQVISLWVIDGIDGRLARRFNLVSVLGGNLDKEGDAIITVTVCLMLIHLDRIGLWILVIGLIRFVYLIFLGFLRRESKSPPSSPLSTFTTGFTHILLGVRFVLDWELHTALLILATVLMVISYCRGVYYALR
ncbi:MAG: CDP-alcohol phosphatidyltransferase family protein [Acidobacteriota bacterium]|nr:CDP-alcohol phosphatidyltransferase family protein [Acidobacteriota bacterium]